MDQPYETRSRVKRDAERKGHDRWEVLGLGPAPGFIARTTPSASVAYAVLFLITFAMVGRNDYPYDQISFIGATVADHNWSGTLLCGYFTAAMMIGLVALAALEIRKLLGGAALGLLLGVAAGGFYIGGYPMGFLPACLLAGAGVAVAAFAKRGSLVASVFFGTTAVLVSLQVAFWLMQAGIAGDVPPMSPEYIEIMQLESV